MAFFRLAWCLYSCNARSSAMSQRNVELIIGKLATDEEFRRLFQDDRDGTIRQEVERGSELTKSEIAALVSMDAGVFDRVAEALDPRIQKASLRSGTALPGGRIS
jgi:hypothetical protein